VKKFFILRGNSSRSGVLNGLVSILSSLPEDVDYQVVVEPYKENKTVEQRNSFHLLCKIFGDDTGYTQGEIKSMVVSKVFGTTNVMGVEVGPSTEKLKMDDYSRLIEGAYILAAEAGVVLPILRR